MKTFLKILGLVVALSFAFVPGQKLRAQGDNDNGVSFQTFYDQLASQGTWVQTSDYGYVFQPTVTDPNWRPYTYGHWVSTDEGLMWVSDEPFGWATYHYGRWVNLDNYGWVWVPGYTWAPAWVSWREGDDYCGWAPLPPDSAVGIDVFGPESWFGWLGFGFHIGGDCDTAYGIGPAWYNFCPVAYVGDRTCWRHFADRRDNFAIINGTRNITNLNVANSRAAGRFGRVHAGGPSVATLNARSRTPLQQVHLTSASILATNGRVRGNSLSVYAPNFDPGTSKTARPHELGRTLTQTSVNRGTDINRSLVTAPGLRAPAPTAGQIHAAALAQGQGPASARIATMHTQASRSLTQPLTSFHPNPVPESRYTGEAVTPRTSASAVPESRFTGEAALPHASAPAVAEPRFTGEPASHYAPSINHESPFGSYFHPYNPGASSYHPSSVIHQSSAPVFHPSAPAYHPQPSFRPSAPAVRYGGGAPAAHFSGGGAAQARGAGGGYKQQH